MCQYQGSPVSRHAGIGGYFASGWPRMDTSVAEALACALDHHRAGRLDEAEACYRQVLDIDIHHADALHLLGLIAGDTWRLELAYSLILAAIAENGQSALYPFNLALLLQREGRKDEAVAYLQRALALEPSHAEAALSLGSLLLALGRPQEAVEGLERALAFWPQEARLLHILGQGLYALGRPEEAAACLRRGTEIAPERAEIHNTLGVVLQNLGQPTEAIACYRRVLAMRPDSVEATSNLGLACRDLGQLGAAETCFRRALTLRSDSVEAMNNLGLVLRGQGRLIEAEACYRQALTLQPESLEALLNLGNVLLDQGRPADAVACGRQALAIQPDHRVAHDNLLFALCFQEDADPAAVFAEHRRFDDGLSRSWLEPIAAKDFSTHDRSPERRLRVGYVSPDFRRSPCGHSLLPVLDSHNRSEVELFCYDNTAKPDDITALFQRRAEHWRPCRTVSDERLAEYIRADAIDILVDCGGHMAGTRLPVLGLRPAPVQISYPLYPNTTGMAAVDYRIVDPFFAPPWADVWHSEKLIRLPETHVCYRPSRTDILPAAEPPAFANGFVTFGSFNNVAKMGPATVAAWAAILRAVPDAKLRLKWNGLGRGDNNAWCLDRFAPYGIGPERLILMAPTPDPYTPYRLVDIALDPLVINGGTTTFDALWMGVPVITRVGRTPFSRVGLGHLTHVGLLDAITEDTETYIAVAVALAQQPDRLVQARLGLRERFAASPLMDAPSYSHHLEQAYRIVWRRWCAGEAPTPLTLARAQ